MGRGKKWYRKQRIQRSYIYNPWTCTKGGNAGGLGGARQIRDKVGKIGKTAIA